MSVWAQLDHVRGRLTQAEITVGSSPSAAEVQDWLDEAEAETSGVLAACEIATDYAPTSRGGLILRKHVVDYVEGRVRSAWASADGEADNEDGQREIERYNDRLRDIEQRPAAWSARLSESGQASQSSRLARSHTTTGGQVNAPVFRVGDVDGAF